MFFQCFLCRINWCNHNNTLNRHKNHPCKSDRILIAMVQWNMYQSRGYHHYPSCFPPKFSAIVVSEFPRIHIFIERVVLYPDIPFICLGQCFHIILPPITITTGTIKSHININHQNHIKSTSIYQYHSFCRIAYWYGYSLYNSPANSLINNCPSRR